MGDGAEIRSASPDDAAAIAAIYAPYVADTVITFEESAPDAAGIRDRMLSRPRLPWLVAVDGDAVVGYAYASLHRTRAAYRWAVDVAVYLDADARGRGIGRRLYGVLLPTVGALGYVTAYAGITLPNPASVALHEAMGFMPVGVYRNVGYKHGAWRDVGWWQHTLADPPAAPPQPTEFSGQIPTDFVDF